MTTITFDTLKYANRLKAAGVPDKQAEAMSDAQAEIQERNLSELATKGDLREMRLEMDARFEKVFGELVLVKWMLGILMAGVLTIILRTFFPH